MSYTLSIFGNLTIDDIVLYDTGQLFLERCGGDALYAAIGARVWEAVPTVVCRIGNNYPESELQKLPELGIKTSLIRVDSNDIRNWALYEPGGARQFINHLSSGMNADMSIHGDEIAEDTLAADGYHVAPMPTEQQQSVIHRLNGRGLISWDPYFNSLLDATGRKMAYELLEYVDLFLPSKEEAVAIFQSDDITEAARSFADAGPKVVAIKMSNRGSLVYEKSTNAFFHIPVYPSVIIDPTGAGDSYCGGFLAGYMKTGDAVAAACYGTVSASYVIEYVDALMTFDADFSTAANRLKVVMDRVTRL